jgi:four helix bundle protein
LVVLAIGLARAISGAMTMTPQTLRDRTKKFAVDVVKLAKKIPRDQTDRLIASQLTRAATGTAAAYRAACRARSRADFIYKLGNAIEEADESALWLEILTESDICSPATTAPLWKEADELTRIFVGSRETARHSKR